MCQHKTVAVIENKIPCYFSRPATAGKYAEGYITSLAVCLKCGHVDILSWVYLKGENNGNETG